MKAEAIGRQRVGRGRLVDGDLGVENHPQRVAAPEHRRRRIALERKGDAHRALYLVDGGRDRPARCVVARHHLVGRRVGHPGRDLGRRHRRRGQIRLLGRRHGSRAVGVDLAGIEVDVEGEVLAVDGIEAWRHAIGEREHDRAAGRRNRVHHALDLRRQVRLERVEVDRYRPVEGDSGGSAVLLVGRLGVGAPVDLDAIEGRVAPDLDRRLRIERLGLLGLALLLGDDGGILGALHQFRHHGGRQRRRQPRPPDRQQVDEQLFARLHAVDRGRAAQSEAHPAPVRIDPADGGVVGQRDGHVRQRQRHLLVEGDRQHVVVVVDLVGRQVHAVREFEDQPPEPVFAGGLQLHAVVGTGGHAEGKPQQRGQPQPHRDASPQTRTHHTTQRKRSRKQALSIGAAA